MVSNPVLFVGLVVISAVLGMMIIEAICKKIKEVAASRKQLMIVQHEHEQEQKAAEEAKVSQTEKKQQPTISYAVLIEILNTTIQNELYFTTRLKFDFQDVKIIDFNQNLATISSHIMDALADTYLEDLYYYHNKKWVMEYVVRKVRIYLTDYIKKHPVS